MVADKAYVGSSALVDYAVITPRKNPQTLAHRNWNTAVSQFRCPIEQFFGRLTKQWLLWSSVYTLDHIHFDQDFDNCLLLCNYGLPHNQLSEADQSYYRSLLAKFQIDHEELTNKRKRQSVDYRQRKRARLQELLSGE